MDFMHHVFGDNMEGAYMIAMCPRHRRGGSDSPDPRVPPEGDRFRVLKHHESAA